MTMNIDPLDCLYQCFIQSVHKTPPKVAEALSKMEKLKAELPENQKDALETITAELYDAGECFGFRAGMKVAWDLWQCLN